MAEFDPPSNVVMLPQQRPVERVTFNRQELDCLLNTYGRMVASGEWRDYAIDFTRDSAIFSVYRRASEMPLYTIEKVPKLKDRQGQYRVVTVTGLILKRGSDLKRVLMVLEPPKRVL